MGRVYSNLNILPEDKDSMWTRSTRWSLITAAALLCVGQVAGAQSRRVSRVEPVKVQAPVTATTQRIVRNVQLQRTNVHQPRGRTTRPRNRPLSRIRIYTDSIRVIRPTLERLDPVRQEKVRMDRRTPGFHPSLSVSAAMALPTTTPSTPRRLSATEPRPALVAGGLLPEVGDSRAAVLRRMGPPAATVSRSGGQETLVFDHATVLLQNGVVADIH